MTEAAQPRSAFGRTRLNGLDFRPANEGDWPLIWPIFADVVAAGDTYTYDLTTDSDQGRQLWLGSGDCWLVTGHSDGTESGGGSDGAETIGAETTGAGTDGAETTGAGSDGAEVVLGSYKVGPNRAGPGAHIGTASYMVAAEARGRGVGRAMVLHSLEQARAAGFAGVQFNAVAASNVHAVRLYRELGFEIVGAVPAGFRHPELGFVDLLIMYHQF